MNQRLELQIVQDRTPQRAKSDSEESSEDLFRRILKTLSVLKTYTTENNEKVVLKYVDRIEHDVGELRDKLRRHL